MTHFFQFEYDFVNSLNCIPMQVRLKLDTCGVKLKLLHWNKFIKQERPALVEMPCTTTEEITAYEEYLQQLVVAHTGTAASKLAINPHPPWLNATIIPSSIDEKAQELGISITLSQWASLTPVQRFALIKLSRPSHENKNFLPALQEFGVVGIEN